MRVPRRGSSFALDLSMPWDLCIRNPYRPRTKILPSIAALAAVRAIAETFSLSWRSDFAESVWECSSFRLAFARERWRAPDNIMVSSRHSSHVTRCFLVRRCTALCSATRPDCALKDLSGIRFRLLREDIFRLHAYSATALAFSAPRRRTFRAVSFRIIFFFLVSLPFQKRLEMEHRARAIQTFMLCVARHKSIYISR